MPDLRIGLGFDLHRIRRQAGGWIMVGGVRLAAPYRIEAHSDGDFVFHAVADAIVSALGLGDIGEAFPPGQAKTKSMDSAKIVAWACRQAKKRKRRLESVSIVIAAEEPKFGPWRQNIRLSLAKALSLKPEKIGLTFKTFEGLFPLSRSVACWANCLIS